MKVYYHPKTDQIYTCDRLEFGLGFIMVTWNDIFMIHEEWLSEFIYLGNF